ncbi:MAG: Bcr/CflA family efflux MFS transporter [Rhodanobacter sp.]|nr:MAG: Bcr/CflA family efflux MFS transporter [Rhodanobacter sp.]TAM10031.1 MAG: Bcr/CflA family efflux MFS transporter [Rhodanobacter sp.]TAM34727.1 MAG: Bcr/CflA family efflux MFS transporter [Rhodanobacter sp.]
MEHCGNPPTAHAPRPPRHPDGYDALTFAAPSRRLFGAALVLGLLSAIGPFAIDMYLPALPAIQRGLHTDVAGAQASLMAFFVAAGLGQVVYGPLSDMVGRKPPLYVGLGVFVLASIGCSLAPNIHSLVAFRFMQGLGACAGMVIPRAVVRDLYTGVDAARLMALLMLVFSVSPILAPLTGSMVIRLADWRGIFWVVAAAALLGVLLVRAALAETRPAAQRTRSSLRSALAGYRLLLRDRTFIGLVFIGASGTASFFTYLANSSFVLIGHYGLTPTQYSIAFSLNAASFIGAAQCTGWLGTRYGLRRVVRVAVVGHVATMLGLFGLYLIGFDRLDLLLGLLLIGYGFLGLTIPITAVLALDRHGPIAGTASALMGTLQFVTGAVVIAAISPFAGNGALPMVAGIAGCATAAFVLVRLTLPRHQPDHGVAVLDTKED